MNTMTRSTRDLVTATTETWNARDRDGYLALYTEDCEVTAPGFAGSGHETLGLYWDAYMTAFPDNRITVQRVLGGDGETPAAEQSVIEGTQTGPLMSADGSVLPPTGRHMSGPFCMVHDQRGGRLTASQLYYDQLDMLDQLGALDGPTAP